MFSRAPNSRLNEGAKKSVAHGFPRNTEGSTPHRCQEAARGKPADCVTMAAWLSFLKNITRSEPYQDEKQGHHECPTRTGVVGLQREWSPGERTALAERRRCEA
jgi:hypothetical protein